MLMRIKITLHHNIIIQWPREHVGKTSGLDRPCDHNGMWRGLSWAREHLS